MIKRGGARKGAGRPKGQSKYNEPTKAVRLPISLIESLHERSKYKLPLYSSKVSAGCPAPTEDYVDKVIDLNEHLVKHPVATFLVHATGNSMINAGIHENDILIVDRSLIPADGKIVIAAIDGQLTVKRLLKKGDKFFLMPENPEFSAIEIREENEVYIWGIVTNVIHSLL